MTELSIALAGLINFIVAALPWILGAVGVVFLIWLAFIIAGGFLIAKGMDQRPKRSTRMGGFR